ncbi:hypothetical protein [uncultured Methanobacterium sp.]|uniref:hypothetical protein n=1 Tax=uncultured Methanobacterium sp. TaxID=176306 RepID=UPI002AA7568C|nr:hypothetical protein [uncultured Methanobacterium sp.]
MGFHDFSRLLVKDLIKFTSGECKSLINDYQLINALIPEYDTSGMGLGEGRGKSGHFTSLDRALEFPLLNWDPEKTKMVIVLISAGEELNLLKTEAILTKISETY